MSLKFTGELFVMTRKNDAKLEKELTCQFQIDMRNLTNFEKSPKFAHQWATFEKKYIMFELKKM